MLKSPFPGMDPYLEAKWPEEPLIDTCYHDGRYHRISYQLDPQPKFDDEDACWIDARLRERGRRV